jgi:hypothetical protein
VGSGVALQCLSTPASRIVQLPGVTIPAGTNVSAQLPPLTITPSVPRGVFPFFAYILQSSNRAVILDLTVTTLDVE